MDESITTIQAVTSLAFRKTETFDLGPLHGRDAREMPGIVRFRRFRASDIWFRHTKLAKNCLGFVGRRRWVSGTAYESWFESPALDMIVVREAI